MAAPANLATDRVKYSPGVPVPKDIQAAVMLEATYLGDKEACAKYGINQRTLQRWRKALEIDPALEAALAEKKRAFQERWLEDLDLTIGRAIRTVGACADAVNADERAKKNPMVIKELSSAIRTLADVKLATRVIDARLATLGNGQGQLGNGNHAEEDPSRLLPGEIEIGPGVFVTQPTLIESNVPAPTRPTDILLGVQDGDETE